MKYPKLIFSFLLFSLLLMYGKTYSQTTIDGYYVSQKDDTIATKIRIRKGAFGQLTNDFLKELEIIDSQKGELKFTPSDIKSFGFSYEKNRRVYVSKPTKDGSHKFLFPAFVGHKSSLYLHGTQTTGSGLPTKQIFYTFEKADGSYLFLTNMLNKKFRIAVKEFYKDSPQVQQVSDTKLNYWLDLDKDLIQILDAANK